MPVTVKTFASFGEAASALSSDRGARYLGGGTLVMRALNEGDISISTVVRATDQALSRIDVASSRITLGAGVTFARILAERDLAFLHAPARSIGGPAVRNMGTVGGNLFAPSSLWRFHRRAAGARRDRLRPGRAWRPRHANRGISAIPRTPERRAGAGGLLCATRERRRLPLSQDRPHQAEGRLGDHAGGASACRAAAAYRGRASRSARWPRRRYAQGPPSAPWRDARSTMPRSAPPPRPQRRAYRPPTTPLAAPGIAARSSASIFAACCPAWSKHS